MGQVGRTQQSGIEPNRLAERPKPAAAGELKTI
jgi:hypothetical protein